MFFRQHLFYIEIFLIRMKLHKQFEQLSRVTLAVLSSLRVEFLRP